MKQSPPNNLRRRHDRLIQEQVTDPYKTPRKLPEATVCPDCKAVYVHGRWTWIPPWSRAAGEALCQACHRTRDDYPAGLITLTGDYLPAHREELIQLMRNREAEERASHPLHRIMAIEEQPGSLVVKTTDIHLPHRIAESIRQAHKGELRVHYDQDGYFLRADWHRDL